MRSEEFSRGIVLMTVSLCTMLYVATLTIVNVALPQMQGALSATPDQISWVVTLNVVATAVATPMTGWLVSRWGDRRVLIWCIVGFSISTFLCATADNLTALLAYRIGQGAFGAPLVPISQAVLIAVYPPERRAFAQSVFGLSVVIGPALAPAVGGYLAETYNWRWIFLLLLPLCVLALISVLAFIKKTGNDRATRLDWTGFVALSIAVTGLQLLLDRGERLDWFESREIVVIAAAMAVGCYIFVVHTATHERPFIDPALFRDINFVVGLLLVFVYGMLNVTPTVLLPPLLQNLKGFPDSTIGWILAMRGLGLAVGFFAAARMGRLDPRIGISIGLVAVGLSGLKTAGFDLNVTAWEVAWTGALQGFGCGVMWVPVSLIAFSTLDARLVPDASAIFHLLRNYGSSILISLSIMVIVRTTKVSYSDLAQTVSPFREALGFGFVTGSWSIDTLTGLTTLSGEITRQAAMIGYINAFVLYSAACVVALPFLLLVRPHRA